MAIERRAIPSLQDDLLAECAALHDHLCPRQVLGVRMGQEAARRLDLDLPHAGTTKRLLTIVETDGCFADGIAVATGCWLGHRTLRCIDHGKIAATFVDTATGEAVRIHPTPTARANAAEFAPDAESRWHAYLLGYQRMPASELLAVERVQLAQPVESLISSPDRRSTCEICGEEIFNGRELRSDGHVRCLGCAGEPYVVPSLP